MAIIGKIRSYSWLLLVFIGLAMLAFILDPGSCRPSGQRMMDTDVGEIAGEVINYRDFDLRVEKQIEMYKQQTQQENVDFSTINQIRQQTWTQLVRDIIMQKEYKELSLGIWDDRKEEITISDDELYDLIAGNDPHPYIRQNFTNPQTGEFNAANVINFIENLDKQEPLVQEQWKGIEKAIIEERLNSKYNNLISKSFYITQAELKRNHVNRNRKIDFRYVALLYKNISDSAVSVTEEEIEKYYEEYKYRYDQEKSRDFDYVIFDVSPSVEDINRVIEWVNEIKPEFEKAEDPEGFVNMNSDKRYDPAFHKKGDLDAAIDTVFFSTGVDSGAFVGPYVENYTYKLVRLMARQTRPDSISARHILIAYQGAARAEATITITKDQAKLKADSIFAVLKKDTTQFKTIAAQLSNDPSNKDNGGELGWFPDGMMVKPFNDACIENNIGDVVVIETDFGFHVLQISAKSPSAEKIQVASVEREVIISDETYQSYFSQANGFLSALQKLTSDGMEKTEAFEKLIIDQGINRRTAEFVKETDYNLPGLDSPREMIRWAYSSEKGDVSQVFDVGGKYVISMLKAVREKGLAPLENVRAEMEAGAKKEKKAEMLIAKFNEASAGVQDINQIGAKLATKVDTAQGISFASYGIPKLGAEPRLIGSVYAQAKGAISKPLQGNNGVIVAIIDNITEAPETSDYTQIKEQLVSYMQSRMGYEVFNALEKKADIKDNRGKFY
ncbi:MAG: peptidylprolyl isomerase [Bacteroidetes bacterium]|nr:peptidylprolyl isomerase [Bacteroidota bacterium]MBU1718383.1 peptidylprolyl isomerase [Bacteroidota bacterium]